MNNVLHANLSTRQSNRHGATVVEFAIVLPILLSVVFGMIELVRMSNLRHAADNASYEAARHVIVPGASASEAIAKGDDLLARAGVAAGDYQISPSIITDETDQVTVQVSVDLSDNSWLPSALTGDHTIVRQTTLMTERGR